MVTRVAVLNDYDVVVMGLAAMLEPFDDIEIVDVRVGDVDLQHPADVALYDSYGRVGMPWDELKLLIDEGIAQNVAVFTFDFAHDLIDRALDLGVRGYLWKGVSRDTLASAIRRISGGEVVVSAPQSHSRVPDEKYRWPFDDVGLSARESEVLALLSEGMSNQQIADALFLNIETVRSHLKQVYSKLGVHSRTQATARALRGDAFTRR